jgi:lysophospholipase L1-like esterase
MSRSPSSRRLRRSLAALTACGLAAAVGLGLSGTAHAAATATTPTAASSARPVTAGADYLALGDSVSFGYREAANLPKPDYPDAASFVGYPEDLATALGLHVANAACPGETSSSFVTSNVASNGCENSPGGGPGYRQAYPLHVTYAATQLSYALKYLRNHPGTRLVSLMIGANDGFLCEETTADHCASELPAVLKQVQANVRTILTGLRDQAGYRGQIVIVDYYSLDYSSATANASSTYLNAAVNAAARPYGVEIANGFTAFETAAAQDGGNSCTAGLLTTLTTGGCGVHPSVAGQALLALAVEKVITP